MTLCYLSELSLCRSSPDRYAQRILLVQVVADIEETFLPLPDDLLVNLADSRAVVEALLDSLPQMFAGNHTVRSPALPCCGIKSTACPYQLPHEKTLPRSPAREVYSGVLGSMVYATYIAGLM